MASPIENEIIGDWNNLKGTEYHLIYALWLLLFRKIPSVAFYQGNDLLAHPITPPIVQSTQSVISLHAQISEEDEWIQLKATEETWTPTVLLKDHLLANFLYNALSSEREQRLWQVQLITQGTVQRKEVEGFIDNPKKKPKLFKLFDSIISEVQQRWQNEGCGSLDKTHLRALGFTILRRLAGTKPVRLETLKAQIETQLAFEYPDPEAVRLIGNALLGALLQSAAPGPESAPIYTTDWVDQVVQRPLMSRTLLTNNPVYACTEAVKATLSLLWTPHHFVPRPRLGKALQQFLTARETVFILIGTSGVGKSWMMADWVTNELKGNVRLLLRGSELYNYSALSALIAAKLQRYAPADWSDAYYLQRLKAASLREDSIPPIIVIDDLHFPLHSGDALRFIEYLGHLIRQCCEQEIKLVLTCQKHVWDIHSYSLSKEIEPQDLFSFETEMRQSPPSKKSQTLIEERQTQERYSFLLSDFTPEELKNVLKQRLPAKNVDHAFLHLQALEFVSLRNPYLLNLYLQRYGASLGEQNNVPTLVSVDELIDQRISTSLQEVAHKLGCNAEDTENAFHALTRLLWTGRSHQLTPAQITQCLSMYVPELGNTALRELRKVGLLASESPIHLAEPVVAARIFAKDLKQRLLQEDEDILTDLHPEIDIDTVSALLRTISDPLPLAENLLERDPRWLSAIASGLAQVTQDPPEDYRAIAFLSVLARKGGDHETYHALGQLAARNKRAWEWVKRMYLSDRIMERFRGGWALATTINSAPDQVKEVLQQRLAKVTSVDDAEREKYNQWLQGALIPLYKINNYMAAEVGRWIISQYNQLVTPDDNKLYHDFLKDIDEIRGKIALWSSSENLEYLLNELQSDDPQTRYRAVCSLRPIVFEHPEIAQKAIFGAIRREHDAKVMNRLLWIVYPIGKATPEPLLAAIKASFVVDWEQPFITTGMTLALLGDLAGQCSSQVSHLLPKSLSAYDWWAQALLSEMLVYAWWRCAEHISDARSHLKALAEVNNTEIPDEFRIFALRASIIAQMGMMCLDMGLSSNELSGKQTPYPLDTLLFVYLNMDDYTKQYSQTFHDHPHYEQLRKSLQACIHEEKRISVHPGQKELNNARYLCARSCREILRNFDGDDTWVVSREFQESVIYSVFRLVDAEQGSTFMRLLHASSHKALRLLDSSLRDDTLLPTLYYWKEETDSWFSLLIARVYARMFDVNPIGNVEAYELCEQILIAVAALPDSSEKQTYKDVYGAIARQLKGEIPALPTLPTPKSLLQNSHVHAIAILQYSHERQESAWIIYELSDRRGWWETTRFQLHDLGCSFGTNAYFLYVFPAVRLAFIAAGQRYMLDDPASQFMKERLQVNALLKEHQSVFCSDIPANSDQLQRVLAIFQEQLERNPSDERLCQSCGHLLLRLERLEEAKECFLHCLTLSSCSQDTRADACYNLACVYAKMGNDEECRQMLQTSIAHRPLHQFSRDWLIRDPDLERVREQAWFQALQQG